ncbi:MAG: hypothetical protein HQL21_07075 [Candidatus Omnitrophica bacterium]|nr:hypothetical protein [Candidatus Omnitrophota bacterium]
MIKKFDLVLLTVLLICMNAWYIQAPYGVSWDNANRFEVFYFFYNHFFFYKDIPQWMPYYSFGIPSHYWQMSALSPASYFFILVGSLFKVSNVLFVFKLCLLVEQQIFLIGMYLLCRKLFQSRATVFVICLAGLASLFSIGQLPYDFFFYYLFPFTMYFFIEFLEKKRPEFFWMTVIMALSWLIGNSLYFIFVWIPVLLFIAGYLILKQAGWGVLRLLGDRSWKNMCLVGLLLVVGFSFFYPLKSFAGYIDFLTRGEHGRNTLNTFLTYTNPDMLQEYCKRFILGDFAASYTGLFILILFFWGMFKLKSVNYHKVFLIAAMGLFWFSFAGVWTSLVYFFPGMAYYRHVGYGYGLLKVLILICAGFSLDMFWLAGFKNKVSSVLIGLLVMVFLLDCSGLSHQWLVDVTSKNGWDGIWKGLMSFDHFFWRFGIYVLAVGVVFLIKIFFSRNKVEQLDLVKMVFIAALCLDICSFQYHIYKEFNAKGAPYPKEFEDSLTISKEPYREVRTSVPRDTRGMNVLIALSGGIKYATIHSVAQFSPCESQERLDLRPRDVSRLLSSGRNEKNLKEVLGCGRPKLRLEERPLLSDDASISQDLFKPTLIPGQIRVKDFNSDELTLDVDAPKAGAWLVYADSYHPGWHATVNGVNQSISRAYLAFKAVPVKGHSTVRFYFNDMMTTICSYIVMFFGVGLCIFLFSLFFRIIYRNLFI